MKVLVIVDSYGWAYHMQTRGLQKYSRNEIIIRKLSDVTTTDIDNADIVHVWSWTNIISIQHMIGKRKIVTGSWSTLLPTEEEYGKYMGSGISPNLSIIESIIISDRRLYEKIRKENLMPNVKVYFSPHQVDTELFKPNPIKHEGFVLGWCGNADRPDKRVELLKELRYPVKVRSLHSNQHLVKERSLKEIVDFYNGLDAYVFVSDATIEGGVSLTILEAMACGLPIVSTNHGSEIKRLLDSDWIIPCNPPKTMIGQMNKKLAMLKANVRLREKVGERNRKKLFDEGVSWKQLAMLYDEVYAEMRLDLKYVTIGDVGVKELQEFLNHTKDDFINTDDDSLYLLGEWKVEGNNLVLPHINVGYACLDKEKIVGIFYWRKLPENFGYGSKCLYPASIVRIDYRGKGIGTRLYELTEALVIKQGWEKLFIANRHNLNGESFSYITKIIQKHGFKKVKEYEMFSNPKGLELKKSDVWNKRKCIMKVFVKELKQ